MKAVFHCSADKAESAITALCQSREENLELSAWESATEGMCSVLGSTQSIMLLIGFMATEMGVQLSHVENDSPVIAEIDPGFELRTQVNAQCDVVIAHCEHIAHNFRIYQSAISAGAPHEMINQIGSRSAQMMEMLLKLRNDFGTDQITDEWMDPVYAAAKDLFPICEVVLTDNELH